MLWTHRMAWSGRVGSGLVWSGPGQAGPAVVVLAIAGVKNHLIYYTNTKKHCARAGHAAQRPNNMNSQLPQGKNLVAHYGIRDTSDTVQSHVMRLKLGFLINMTLY
ncbi:uncharacterized protein LOC115767075 [Drosophila novamexicana]|uniref:uncharacterized protein LOC115767075 n=1 Tax=Drosophila novamexicana TaxID=47314 RepID=UPI0011E5F6DA|nr:uncharacterized protein LOC115767075 [Drosophila novamexicana]